MCVFTHACMYECMRARDRQIEHKIGIGRCMKTGGRESGRMKSENRARQAIKSGGREAGREGGREGEGGGGGGVFDRLD